MLLDQKRTKRMVKIVSTICAVAFVGVLPIVLIVIIFNGGGSDNQNDDLVKAAEQRVEKNPNDLDALVELASLYRSSGKPTEATATVAKAVAIGPKDKDELNSLIGVLADDQGQALKVAEKYTKDKPKDPEGWFAYAIQSERAQQILTARLAFQRTIQLAPKDSLLSSNAQTALDRLKDTPITPVEPLPTTPATPVTP